MNHTQYELASLINALETVNKPGHQTLVNEFYEIVRQAIHDSTAPVEPIDAGFNPTDEP